MTGHSENFRTTIISRVLGKYKNNLANHKSGSKMMFRTKEEREEFYESNGGRKNKATWFRGGKDRVTTTTMVPTTPGGQLAVQMKSALASCPAPGRCRTKVLEGGGTSVKKHLVVSNPFPRQSCGRPDCLLDRHTDGGCRERCYREGVWYCATCSRCRATQIEEGKTTL